MEEVTMGHGFHRVLVPCSVRVVLLLLRTQLHINNTVDRSIYTLEAKQISTLFGECKSCVEQYFQIVLF